MRRSRLFGVPFVVALVVAGITPANATAQPRHPDAGPPLAGIARPSHAPRHESAAVIAGGAAIHVVTVRQISRDSAPVVSGSQPDTQTEPDVAADPHNERIVVATYQQGRFIDGASVDPGYAWSHDAGLHWHHANLPRLTTAVGGRWARASDAAVAFGPDGSVYITTLVVSFGARTTTSGVVVQRSVDHGVTFSAPHPVLVETSPLVFNDKNWITVDTFRASPHYGRIYVAWDRADAVSGGQPQLVSWSDDRGRTWHPAVATPRLAGTIGAQPVVQPDGDLTDVFYLFRSTAVSLDAVTSNDGGRTWTAPVRISDVAFAGPPDIRSGDLPSAVVDPVTGFIHAVWGDGSFRSDGRADIVIASSADGRHWSNVRRVNRPTAAELFTPDVAAYARRVYVSWRSRLPADSRLISMEIVKGNGVRFGIPLRLGPASDLRFAAVAPVAFPGDYMGTWAGAHHVYATWEVSSPPRSGAQFHQVTWGATLSP